MNNLSQHLTDLNQVPAQHQAFFESRNNAIVKAWNRTDDKITRHVAGTYFYKAVDGSLYELNKNPERGGGDSWDIVLLGSCEETVESFATLREAVEYLQQDFDLDQASEPEPVQVPVPEQSSVDTSVLLPSEIEQRLNNGATLVVSISGGKDSDVMALELNELFKARNWQGKFILVHSDLGRMEWQETLTHCYDLAHKIDARLAVVQKTRKVNGKEKPYDLLMGFRARLAKLTDDDGNVTAPPFASSSARYCTSDWKRAVIDKWLRNEFKADADVIVAIGLRRDESSSRAKKPVTETRKGASAPTKNRNVTNWYPVLHYTQAHIDAVCEKHNWNLHVAYQLGNERLSCQFCVMACSGDLSNGAEHNPKLYRQLVNLELKSGFAYQNNKPLWRVAPEHLTPAQLEQVKAIDSAWYQEYFEQSVPSSVSETENDQEQETEQEQDQNDQEQQPSDEISMNMLESGEMNMSTSRAKTMPTKKSRVNLTIDTLDMRQLEAIAQEHGFKKVTEFVYSLLEQAIVESGGQWHGVENHGGYREKGVYIPKEQPKRVKLTQADADEIRALYAKGEGTYQELADKYGVSHSTIGYIIRGETFSDPLEQLYQDMTTPPPVQVTRPRYTGEVLDTPSYLKPAPQAPNTSDEQPALIESPSEQKIIRTIKLTDEQYSYFEDVLDRLWNYADEPELNGCTFTEEDFPKFLNKSLMVFPIRKDVLDTIISFLDDIVDLERENFDERVQSNPDNLSTEQAKIGKLHREITELKKKLKKLDVIPVPTQRGE